MVAVDALDATRQRRVIGVADKLHNDVLLVGKVVEAFPYLLDEDQAVAKAYRAACTPDFFVFDGDRKLVYRGQLDDSRPSNDKPVDGRDLRAALDAVLSGRAIDERQVPSIGCNIKWIPGNEPDYF